MDELNIFRITILSSAFILTLIGILIYRIIAIRFNIVAVKNYRTLHDDDTPKGSGIVFALVFIFLVFIVFRYEYISNEFATVICLGGLVATIFGFVDDVLNISAKFKLLIQLMLSTFLVLWFGEVSILFNAGGEPLKTGLLGIIIGIIAITWLINLYNFMDGVDGMAASGTVFIASVIAGILFCAQNSSSLGLVSATLAVSSIAFLLFNWPTAKIFMGDAGSVFIGYTFGGFIVYTMIQGYISIWTWITVFGYFGIDTTVTLILRIIKVKRWYDAHRSHAYQNLARIWGSHKKILFLVITYHILWVLPLTIATVLYVQFQEIICLVAISPAIIWTLKYGPLLSSD